MFNYAPRMNHLAHLYLSGKNENLIVGNFLGDFVRQKHIEVLPKGIAEGVGLHRFIDSFTDSHLEVRKAVILLRPYFGKYAPVVLDVFFDYYLASNWSKFEMLSLQEFSKYIEIILESHKKYFTDKAFRFYNFMLQKQILLHYQTKEGISEVLFQMAKRARFESGMENAGEVLEKHHNELLDTFHVFFPQLVANCVHHIQSLSRNE
jgi:acyl carrier protein phosphodiesterase